MKAECDSASEKIWAYLHGECDAETRQAIEKEIARDGALRTELGRARNLDCMLRAALPALSEQSPGDEALAEQALAAWDRQNANKAAFSPARPVPVRWRAFSPVGRRIAVGLSGLAAAAALVVAVTLNFRTPQPAKWEDPTFIPLAWRGPDTQAGGRAIDACAARRCQEALMASVACASAARKVALPPGLVFSVRIQALRNGAFSMCVQARLRAGRNVGEWDGVYSGLDAFFKNADVSADRIVGEVAAFLGGEGGRP